MATFSIFVVIMPRRPDRLNEGLTLSRNTGDQQRIIECLILMGDLSLIQTELDQARQHYHEALTRANRHKIFPLILHAMIGVARLKLHVGHLKQAAQLLGLVFDHPALAVQDKEHSGHLVYTELQKEITAEELHFAMEIGKSLDLDKMVQDMLAELGNQSGD